MATRRTPTPPPPTLSQIDLLALVAIARLGPEAYGVSIRDEIIRVTTREISMAATYAALDRLEGAALIDASLSAPRPERGGRARRQFQLTAAGRATLKHERDLTARLWRGVSLDAGVES
jgi:DNA-binding PadR family transcriptional regulator